jgi:GxxExxY protein
VKSIDELASIVVDAGFQIHNEIGPGLLESAYEAILAHMLVSHGLVVERQKVIPIKFRDLIIDQGFRADIVIDNRLLVELKSVEALQPVHGKQVLTYLKLMNLPLGLLINFNVPMFRNGIRRIANGHADRKE